MDDQNAHSQPLQSINSYTNLCRSPQCRQDHSCSLSHKRNRKKMFIRWASNSNFGFQYAISVLRTTNLTSTLSTVETKASLTKAFCKTKHQFVHAQSHFTNYGLYISASRKKTLTPPKITLTLSLFFMKHIKTACLNTWFHFCNDMRHKHSS